VSSKKYATPLVVELTPSVFFLSLLCLFHLVGIAVLLMLDLSVVIKILVIIFVLISLYYNLSLHPLLRAKYSIIALRWLDENEWQLTQRDGEKIYAHLNMNSYRHPLLVVLNFNIAGSKINRSVIIFFDAIDGNTFRQLRVRLRLLQNSKEQE